jgi:hypothetical protein
MAVILPPQSEANNSTTNNILANIATANANFIASTTVLINNAIANDFYEVEPFIIPFLSIPTVTAYFQALGYTVTFPIIPPGPWGMFYPAAGFPEVVPGGSTYWAGPFNNSEAPRLEISWAGVPTPPIAQSFLQLESGDLFLLEDGISGILLEQQPITPLPGPFPGPFPCGCF